jgi:HEPN domain-containing protein
MLTRQELRTIAKARLREAEGLFQAGQFEGAAYLCGYVVELALKARIARHLRWSGFPETSKEFEGIQNLRTHDLKILLRFTGLKSKIDSSYLTEWATISEWTPEFRYNRIGSTPRKKAEDMIRAAGILLGVIR